MKVCLHQIFRVKSPKIKIEGEGDCSVCVPDEKNKLCKRYHPITVVEIKVYDK